MDRYSLTHLADDSLLDRLHTLAERDRAHTADLLAHIGEVAQRRLYAHLGYPSMQAYCIRVLHLSEDAARKRVQVARKGWLLPSIFEAIADGRVHLSGMKLLAPFIDEQNVHELIEAAHHRTCREIECFLAERFPKVEAEERVDEVSGDAARHLDSRTGVKPIAPGRYVVQFTIDEADHQRLQYALQLMSHRNPQGRLSVLNQAAIETLIAELENEKLGATDDPRESDTSPSDRHIPRAVRREVVQRDGWQCSYVSPAGRRCESRWQLEFDHVHEFARGGRSTVDNVRLLCRAHNQYAAECTYGAGFMDEKRLRAARPEEAVRERRATTLAGASPWCDRR
jgi:5-methylcytosine-specific restriction endonuclease McrA